MSVYKRISNWNEEIIQPINELVENPPGGCDALDPLDEAEEDYLWKKQDIIDVQEKLKEICPDNEFEELKTPQLATREIIDEILVAIALGWCGCEEVPDSWSLGTFTCQEVSGTTNSEQCCGIIHGDDVSERGAFWWLWGYTITTYLSPYIDINAGSTVSYGDAVTEFDTAKTESHSWLMDRRDELYYQSWVEYNRNELEGKEAALEVLQLQLAACTINCEDIQSQITEIEQEISDLEDEIAEDIIKRDEAKEKAEEHLSKADAAAEANWAALLAMTSFDPNTINIINLIGELSGSYESGPDTYIRGSFNVTKSGTHPLSGEFLDLPVLTGYFTPSGLPYTKGWPLIWGSYWYWEYETLRICVPSQAALGICDDDTYETEYHRGPSISAGCAGTLELTITLGSGGRKVVEYEP